MSKSWASSSPIDHDVSHGAATSRIGRHDEGLNP